MRLTTEFRVQLSLLSHNFDLIKKIAPKNETIFMVKANAYGHGILEVVFHAFHELGVKRFGCATVLEAMEIRKAFPSMLCELWVFSDSNLELEKAREFLLDYNITPVIHNLSDLKLVLSNKEFQFLPLILKFDTGMNRLGLSELDLEELIRELKISDRQNIFHVMTHFANSYLKLKKTVDKTQRQYLEFQKILHELRSNGLSIEETSCSNSGAIEQSFGLEESHIRPGLMLYGPRSVNKTEPWAGKTISTFETEVLKVEQIKKGVPVGYGSHVCGNNGFVVYLPVGYGDGILTYYSGSKITLHGKEAQIIGRVNMDITAVFFKELPSGLSSGSRFTFWDHDSNDLTELSTQLKTTPYQVFTAISNRVPRRYIK